MSRQRSEPPQDKLEVRSSRRRFLKGAGAGALIVGSSSVLPKALATDSVQVCKTPDCDYDTIVIGGGFAGVTAASELSNAGEKTLLLEARSRLGGLTFTSEFAGQPIEMGGTWIHWLQPHVWAKMQRYGLGVEESPVTAPSQAVLLSSDGHRKTYDPMEMMGALAESFEKYCYDASIHFPRPFEPLFSPSVHKLDQVSMLERLKQTDLTADQQDMTSGLGFALSGIDLDEAGMAGILKSFACAGWNFTAFMDTQSHYKIEGGTIALINAMINDCNAEVSLSSPVESIAQRDNKVLVTIDDGRTISAASVVITIPLNTYKNIEFSPALSKHKQRITSTPRQSKGLKVYVHVKQNLGQVLGLGAHTQPINVIQTEHYDDHHGTILVALGGSRDLLDINDDEAVAEQVKRFFPDVDVLGSAGYDWVYDLYSQGTWPAFRVNEMTKDVPAMQKPEGRLVFAGGATANGWHEWIDGAIESGLRAAREVKSLQSEARHEQKSSSA